MKFYKSQRLFLLIEIIILLGFFIIPVASADISPSIHPRLYYTSSELPAIKARMDQVSTKPLWVSIQGTAKNFNQFPSQLTGSGDLGNILIGLRYTSFTYAMTGDTVIGNKSKSWLLQACSWPSWTEPLGYNPQSTTPIPDNTGIIAISVAEAYDNLYPLLNTAERKTVQDAIISKAVVPAYNDYITGRYLFHDKTNRAAQCYGGIAVAALAIAGDTENPDLNTYHLGLHTIMDNYFSAYDRDGAWSEGLTYESYGQAGGSGAIYYVEALKHVKGEDLSQHTKFKNAMNYPLYFSPPDRLSATDSFNDANFDTPYSGAATAWFTSTYQSGLVQWYYNNIPQSHDDKVGEFLWLNASVPVISPATLPSSKHFQDLGLVAMRSGWKYNDILIGFLSGPLTGPGAHYRPEQNSFMLDAFGEHLIIEPGTSSLGYSDPSYATYYQSTLAQNTILINNDPKSQIGYSKVPIQTGKVIRFFTSGIMDTVTGSAAPAYNGKLAKFNRTMIFVKPDYVIVFDDLESATGAVEFDSLLHALGTNSISVSGNTITIAQNTAKLSGTILSPQNFRYSVQVGQPVKMSGADQPTSYIKIYPSSISTSMQFLSVLYPQMASDTSFPVTKLNGTGVTGVRVDRNGVYDSILIKTGSAGFEMGDISSDSSICLIRNSSTNVNEISIVDGKSLTLQGYQYFASDMLSSAALHYSNTSIDGLISSDASTRVRIHADVPTKIVVNGNTLPTSAYSYEPDTKVLSFSLNSGENRIYVEKNYKSQPSTFDDHLEIRL